MMCCSPANTPCAQVVHERADWQYEAQLLSTLNGHARSTPMRLLAHSALTTLVTLVAVTALLGAGCSTDEGSDSKVSSEDTGADFKSVPVTPPRQRQQPDVVMLPETVGVLDAGPSNTAEAGPSEGIIGGDEDQDAAGDGAALEDPGDEKGDSIADEPSDPCTTLETSAGCPDGYPGACLVEAGRDADEALHKARLSRDVEIQALEVSQADWQATWSGWNAAADAACGGACPVETVSWYDALAYANARSEAVGLMPCYVFSDVHCASGTDPATAATRRTA